jgi:RHS repeat-associated protein
VEGECHPAVSPAPPPDGNGAIQTDDVTEVAGQQGEVCLSSYVYNGDGLRTRGEGNWGLTCDYVWDVAAGSHYPCARFYDPGIARFLTQDPAASEHPYAYVRNNPANLTDPSGAIPDCTVCEEWGIPQPPQIDPNCRDPECVALYSAALVNWAYNVFAPALTERVQAATEKGGEIVERFGTLECLTAAITVAGVATGGWAVAISTAVNVGLSAAAGHPEGVVKEPLGVAPEAGTAWLRKALQTYGAYGNIRVPGGGQPVITTVRNLRTAGAGAFVALSVYECVRSRLD